MTLHIKKGVGGIGDADGSNDGSGGDDDVFFHDVVVFVFGYVCSYCSSGESINLQRQRFVSKRSDSKMINF